MLSSIYFEVYQYLHSSATNQPDIPHACIVENVFQENFGNFVSKFQWFHFDKFQNASIRNSLPVSFNKMF